jgi:hypothetical protein
VDHPKDIGDRSTLAVMLALQQRGYTLLLPFGENTRYDVVIEDAPLFARVQCKTGRLRDGAVVFRTCSSYAHHPNPRDLRRDYTGQVEYFGVFCPDNGGIYLVPIEDVETRNVARLRVTPPRNSQVKKIRDAADCEIARLVVPSAAPALVAA